MGKSQERTAVTRNCIRPLYDKLQKHGACARVSAETVVLEKEYHRRDKDAQMVWKCCDRLVSVIVLSCVRPGANISHCTAEER